MARKDYSPERASVIEKHNGTCIVFISHVVASVGNFEGKDVDKKVN